MLPHGLGRRSVRRRRRRLRERHRRVAGQLSASGLGPHGHGYSVGERAGAAAAAAAAARDAAGWLLRARDQAAVDDGRSGTHHAASHRVASLEARRRVNMQEKRICFLESIWQTTPSSGASLATGDKLMLCAAMQSNEQHNLPTIDSSVYVGVGLQGDKVILFSPPHEKQQNISVLLGGLVKKGVARVNDMQAVGFLWGHRTRLPRGGVVLRISATVQASPGCRGLQRERSYATLLHYPCVERGVPNETVLKIFRRTFWCRSYGVAPS